MATAAEIVTASLIAQQEGLVSIRLVGDAQKLEDAVRQRGASTSDIHIVHTDQYVGRRENGVRATKIKRHTSLQIAAELSQTHGGPWITFGNGNALREVIRTSLSVPGRLCPFASRLSFGDRAVTVLDVGPYVHTTGSQLTQFGLMGAAFHGLSTNVSTPTVGLLSGEQSISHCPDHLRETHLGLHEQCAQYVGLVTGEDMSKEVPDVLVVDSQFGSFFRQRELSLQRKVDPSEEREETRPWRGMFGRSSKPVDTPRNQMLESIVVLGAQTLAVYRPEADNEQSVLSAIRDAVHVHQLNVAERIRDDLGLNESKAFRSTTEHPVI
jgi:fatty acid/phospholipid biosynthesis enzyme